MPSNSIKIEKWGQDKFREGLEQGMEKGRKEGKTAMLTKALALKFGAVPQKIQQQIDQANIESIKRWSEQLLTANHLNDVFK